MHIINNASDLLKAMRECGFVVKLNGGVLEVEKAHWIDEDLANDIRKYKHDLIKLLTIEMEATHEKAVC